MGNVAERAVTPLTPKSNEVKDKGRLGVIEELRSSV